MDKLRDVFDESCDPNTIDNLHKAALQHGRNSKQFIEFANEIFAYWKSFYAAAVKIDVQTRKQNSEITALRAELVEAQKDAKRLDWILSNPDKIKNTAYLPLAVCKEYIDNAIALSNDEGKG